MYLLIRLISECILSILAYIRIGETQGYVAALSGSL